MHKYDSVHVSLLNLKFNLIFIILTKPTNFQEFTSVLYNKAEAEDSCI